jgi:outer membrane lipoprotein SlyB
MARYLACALVALSLYGCTVTTVTTGDVKVECEVQR